MKAILERWLENILAAALNLDNAYRLVKDGTVFIKILKFYNAINVESVSNISGSEDLNICRQNLICIRIWFTLLEIDFSDEIIDQILEGNSGICINILYKLYVAFEKRCVLPLISKQKIRCKKKVYKNFTVSKVNIEENDSCSEGHYNYADKIHEHKTLIDWYEDKLRNKERTKWTCKKDDKKYSITPTHSESVKLSLLNNQMPPVKYSLLESSMKSRREEDIRFVKEVDKNYKVEIPKSMSDFANEIHVGKFFLSDPSDSFFDPCKQSSFLPPISSSPSQFNKYILPRNVKEYMKKLKSNTDVTFKQLNLSKLCKSAIKKTKDVIKDRECLAFKDIISYRLLKRSSYEKELIAKFHSLRNQFKVQKECYIDLENEIMKLRKSGVSLDVSLNEHNNETDNRRHSVEGVAVNSNNDDDILNSSYFNSCKQRYMYDDSNAYIQNEKRRTVELHRRLYAEKLKLQFDRHYAICLHALEDMIELAIRKSELFIKYGVDVPRFMWSDWKCLLHNNLPITEDVGEAYRTLMQPDLNDMDVVTELFRQDILNENNLDMYLHLKDDWDYHLSPESEEDYMAESDTLCTVYSERQIALGYVVHRVIDNKYSIAPEIKPASLTKLPIMAVVNGIDNLNAIENLKVVFGKANILLVDVNTAVNFCLQSFKDSDSNNNAGKLYEDANDNPSFTISDTSDIRKVISKEFKEECTQTSSLLFDETYNDSLQAAAALGSDIFTMMSFGNELPFDILVQSIIQYIKDKEHEINGWVLVNVPSTMYQASVLEFALTGKKFPYSMEDDLNSSSESQCKVSDTGKETVLDAYSSELKSSRIVPNPYTISRDELFKTHFSMYVTMIKGSYVSGEMKNVEIPESHKNRSDSTMLLEQPDKEGVPTLHNFYRDQGIGYDFIYESFDLNALTQLVRVYLFNYLQEMKLLKMTNNVFSEELLHEFEPAITLKWHSSTRSSMDGSNIFRSTKAQSLSVDNLNANDSESDGPSLLSKIENIKFADYPLPDNILRILASYWEALENVYVNNLKETFLVKRITDYTALPYILFVTNHLFLAFQNPDDRQNIVTTFLNEYNSINQVSRSNIELKNELHLRVLELKEKLIQLCVENRDTLQYLKTSIINQNWAYQELALYTNCFISFLQIEADRSVRTFQFLQDYYLAMLEIYNSEPIPSINVEHVNIYTAIEVEDETSLDESIVEGEEEEFEDDYKMIQEFKLLQLKRIIENYNIEEVDNELYKSVADRIRNYSELPPDSVIPFYDILCDKTDDCHDNVLKIKSLIEDKVVKEELAALKKLKDKYVKPSMGKDVNKSQKNSPNDKKILQESSTDVTNQNLASNTKEENEETLLKDMFKEWKLAINNEVDRFNCRIKSIKMQALFEFNAIEELFGSKFFEFDTLISETFLEEISCINKICSLLQFAIEEKTPLNVNIIFQRNKFYVIRPVIQDPEPSMKLPVPLDEILQEESFTITQLKEITKRLRIIAPSGLITREALVGFFDNIICTSSENIYLVPALWSKLQFPDLELLFQRLFGSCSIIEWRDFLIYCLHLPFPLTEDIVDAKLQFLYSDSIDGELIHYDDYMKTTLWFQRELPENPSIALHYILAKDFLFSLFETSGNLTNYSALLLAFCRDIDPKVGFGKSLSLFMNRCVIVYEEDFYLEEVLTDYINTDVKIVNGLLLEIINDVVSNSLSNQKHELGDFYHARPKQESMLQVDDDDLDNTDDNDDDTDDESDDDNNNNDNNNENFNLSISETMYYQIFRRFSSLRWVSKVPRTLITTVLCVTFSTILKPYRTYLYCEICVEIYKHMMDKTSTDIVVPQFVNNLWVEQLFDLVRKFSVCPLLETVKEIVSKHELPHNYE